MDWCKSFWNYYLIELFLAQIIWLHYLWMLSIYFLFFFSMNHLNFLWIATFKTSILWTWWQQLTNSKFDNLPKVFYWVIVIWLRRPIYEETTSFIAEFGAEFWGMIKSTIIHINHINQKLFFFNHLVIK